MPLLEIVTGANYTHPEDAKLIVRELQDLLVQLDISDAEIDKGQMRVDVNVSVASDSIGGNRVEIKNVAGAKNVERAVECEYRRHIDLLSRGIIPEFETRRYDAIEDVTHSLRKKEEEPDYRFFQDPDLPAFHIDDSRIARSKTSLKEVPFDEKRNFCRKYGMDVADTKTVFRYPWSISLFSSLVQELACDPRLVY